MRGGFLFLALFSLSAFAEEPTEITIPEINVLGESGGSSLDRLLTVDELSGARLDRRRRTTLGETLSGETGVSSTQFGPNASRPVIRGLGGERIRILQNGTGVLDASAASEDHAVAFDPLTIERTEIVRGPISLLYGNSAVGGVVNIVTNRIPEQLPESPTGRASTEYSTVDKGRNIGFSGEAKIGGRWALHLDGLARRSEDYKVPGFQRTAAERQNNPLGTDETEGDGKVINSANKGWSGGLGASYIGSDYFAGASLSNYSSRYGTVAEQSVGIDLDQRRLDLAAGKKNVGVFESLRFRGTVTNYRHREMEGGEVGTTFRNRGGEARVEGRHRKSGVFSGTAGLQATNFQFEAVGDEAFLPTTHNGSYAAFFFEEADLGRWKPSIGLRGDLSRVASEDSANFGAGEAKNFTNGNISLGVVYELNKEFSLALNTGLTARAPNYQELFADGQHVATRQFERGDRNLRSERGRSAELSLRHQTSEAKGYAGVFVQDFSNFIALSPTGNADPQPGIPEYAYRSVRARLYGAELSYRHDLPSLIPGGRLEAEVKLDSVRGRDTGANANLPRITPIRESLTLTYKAPFVQVDAQVQNVEKQTKTAPNETATAGYTLTNLSVEAPVRFDAATLSVFARLQNAFNVEARNHVSVLKDIAPLPGRNFNVGVQAVF